MSAWVGAGVLAAGMSAALIAGADTASADTGSDASASGVSAGGSAASDRTGPSRAAGVSRSGSSESDPSETTTRGARSERSAGDATGARQNRAARRAEAEADADAIAETRGAAVGVERAGRTDAQDPPSQATAARTETRAASPDAVRLTSEAVTPQQASTKARQPSIPDAVQSLVFDVIGVAVTAIAGPPVAAPGTNVTVRSSTLEITPGRRVPADWYYPAGAEPPQRLIYLQHGFLGVGAMYSYTASYLAARTDSIVVVPTLSSNRFVQDGFWLGDDQVYHATANLLLGDREALTASAVAAGFAERYGAAAALPEEFMLFGHSLGAGVAAGAAGYYAQAVNASGARNRLAGVVLLDGAPPVNVLPDALDALDLLADYIPVFELGAPKPSRRVDTALIEHRPDRYNGIVLDDGKHLDAMQGGTPAIQFISYLYQGFPTEKNKSAAQTIIAGWADDVFAGRIDPSTGRCEGADCTGIYAAPGDAVEIPTPLGAATGVVIGKPTLPTVGYVEPTSIGALSGGGVFIPV
ncbi:hypothetical protein ACN27E_23705 [Mycobacterium sp. WMMD1722]|uniref:hypothetical protein n=1 Tax=Mycobacterium sp. WMMD1722 TaxID=3404117 RepID=UPI003BF60155